MSVSNVAPNATPQRVPTLTRANLILAALLLVQIAIAAWVLWPRGQATSPGEPLVGALTADQVTSLTISDDADRSVSLERVDGTWTLAGTDGYPANSVKISTTLASLLDITTDRLVTRTPGSHSRLQVGDDSFMRKVDLGTGAGTTTLYLGSSAGASATHVRLAGSDPVYLSGGLNTWELETSPVNWIDVTYFSTPVESIQSVKLENANGVFNFVRDAANEWTLADLAPGEPIAPANISTMISRIATLNLHTVLGKSEDPAYGLASPLATLTVAYTDEGGAAQTATLVVGAKDEATNTYYLKSSTSDYYVRLAAFTGDEFVNAQRSSFMRQDEAGETPPVDAGAAITPTAGVTGTGEITATSEITAADEVTATAPVTVDAGIAPTATVPVTSTEAITAGDAITASTSVTTSTAITPAGD